MSPNPPPSTPPRRRRTATAAALLAGAAIAAPAVVAPMALAAPGDVTTVAGGFLPAPATALGMTPGGVAVDAEGGVLVPDQNGGVVRRVDPSSGIARPVAGVGTAGASNTTAIADGPALGTALPGLAAGFAGPQVTAVAPNGDVVVAVGGGGTVRRISADGRIRIIAGDGTYSSAAPGDGGPATSARLSVVRGLAVDRQGGVLIADSDAGRVRRVAPDGTITTVAGGGALLGDGGPAGQAQLRSPRGLALTPTGDLLVAEFSGQRVRRIAAGADGLIGPDDEITTVVGDGTAATETSTGDGGPAGAGRVSGPGGVAILPNGAILVAETTGRRLRYVTAQPQTGERTISTVPTGALDAPADIATDGERVYVPETGAGARRVLALDVDQATGRLRAGTVVRTLAGNGSSGFGGDGGEATAAQLNSPWGVDVRPDGDLHLSDGSNLRFRAVEAGDGRIATTSGSGAACTSPTDATCVEDVAPSRARYYRTWDVAVAADGTVYGLESNAAVSRITRRDPATGRVTRLAGGANGAAGADGGPAADARFGEALSIALTADERGLLVADTGNARVRRIDLADGTITTIAGTGTAGREGDGGPATQAQLASLTGVAPAPDGDVLVTDSSGRRVRRIDAATGRIDTVFRGAPGEGEVELQSVRSVSVAPDGRLAILDAIGHSVYETAPDGTGARRTVGTGERGYNGDAGAGAGLQLASPFNVDHAPDGGLLVAATGNNRIRRVEGPAAPAPPTDGGSSGDAPPASDGAPSGDGATAPGPGGSPGPAAGGGSAVTGASAERPLLRLPRVDGKPRTPFGLRSGLRVRAGIRGVRRVQVELRVDGRIARRAGLTRRPGTFVLARASRTITAPGSSTATLRVRPSASVRAALARARDRGRLPGALRVTVRVAARGADGRGTVRTRVVTVGRR